jgi:hypothetical protein
MISELRGLLAPPLCGGGQYHYHPRDSIKPRWWKAVISGPPPITEYPGPNEPPEQVGVGVQYHYHQPVNTKPRWFMGPISSPHPTSVSPGSSAPPPPEPTHSPASNRLHPVSINSRHRAPSATRTANSTSPPTTDRRGCRGADSRRGWGAQYRRRGR